MKKELKKHLIFLKNYSKIQINKSFKCAITKDDNTYLIVSRIGDTVLIASTNAQYKETVIEIFNSLGY